MVRTLRATPVRVIREYCLPDPSIPLTLNEEKHLRKSLGEAYFQISHLQPGALLHFSILNTPTKTRHDLKQPALLLHWVVLRYQQGCQSVVRLPMETQTGASLCYCKYCVHLRSRGLGKSFVFFWNLHCVTLDIVVAFDEEKASSNRSCNFWMLLVGGFDTNKGLGKTAASTTMTTTIKRSVCFSVVSLYDGIVGHSWVKG